MKRAAPHRCARPARALALAVAIALGGMAPEPAGAQQAVVDLIGVTAATFGWTPASGPVTAYLVYVARNGLGFPPYPDGIAGASDRRVTVLGDVGERIRIRVAAMAADGSVGPFSPVSDEVRFLARPAGTPPYDFRGDGISELLLHDPPSGLFAAWTALPTPSLQTATAGFPISGSWDVVDAADYDGDQRGDLLWREAGSSRVVLCRSDGQSASRCADFTLLLYGWSVIGLGDTNGDGRRDVLLRTIQGGAHLVCLGTGAAISTCGASIGSFEESRWRLLAPGDVDGDDRADLLLHDVATGNLLACSLVGTSLGACVTLVSLGPGQVVTPIGDATGDGQGDLVVRDAAGASTLVCGVAAKRIQSCTSLAGVERRWQLVGAGDYDGDGRGDLVLRDAVAGLVRIDHLSGLARKGAPLYLPAGPGLRVLAQH